MKQHPSDIIFSLILPCYNPIEGWENRILDSVANLSSLLPGEVFQVILVNDGSTRGVSAQSISKLEESIEHFVYVNQSENRGKGFAVRTGAALAKASCLIYTDVDFPYLEENLVKMYYSILNQNSDLVVGVREDAYYQGIPSSRKRISLWYKALLKKLLNIPTSDTQAGLKALSLHAKLCLLECKTDGYLFDLELIKKCSQKKLKINQEKIELKPGIILSKMPIKTLLKEFFNFLKILFS
ncbi:MAG: glycosyltransferase family 2 protein [Chitinophagales bacterium]